MKPTWCVLWLSVCVGTGCVTLPGTLDLMATKPAPVPVEPAAPRPPVTAEQITEANAHERAAALLRELDRQEEQVVTPPVAKAKKD